MASTSTIAKIYRYPVKGLSPEPLERVALSPGKTLPHDRRFAIAHGSSVYHPGEPAWAPKRQFLMLARNPRLAALETTFDDASGVLTVHRDGRQVARGDITGPLGRDLINQFLAAFMADEARGAAKIVEAPGIAFTDTPEEYVSIINAASVLDLERVVRQPIDPSRFRGNLLIADTAAWAEREWTGQTLAIGDVRLKVVEPIGRCAATNVDPDSGVADLNIPKSLMDGYGHADCGVYATVLEGGSIAEGDAITLLA
ncbi:MAG: MOSC domain-containing protein [Inquilinaceae bacterium]